MIDQATQQIINILRKESDETLALKKAAIALLALLQSPYAYKKVKARPPSSFQEFVHKVVLSFKPLSTSFNDSDTFFLNESLSISRKLSEKGQFQLLWPSDFLPIPKKEEYQVYPYHFCISFAGEQRDIAQSLATKLHKDFNMRVFYDDFEKLNLWGKDLFNYLYDVYSEKGRYCIVLFSKDYIEKNWTNHELRAAQSRVLKERKEYILPVILERGIRLPKEFENIAYIDYETSTLEQICQAICDRLWDEMRFHMLSVEEVAEVLNEDFQFSIFMEPFYKAAKECSLDTESLRVFLLGLIWASSRENIVEIITGFFDYLAFAFPPISSAFNDKDELLVIPPDGNVVREIGGKEGPLLMPDSFWNPIVAEHKANNPWLGDDKKRQARKKSKGKLSEKRGRRKMRSDIDKK